MPKVSVIVPNYNHSSYLEQRIESILSQSYQDFELIILDDLSTDNSRTIIEKYRGDSRVSQIIYNEKNSGSTFKQWKKGIELAKGEFIWIAESDDWCEIHLLQELVLGLEKKENCVISYCQSYCIENTNVISWQSSHPQLSEIVSGTHYIRQYLLRNNSIFNASMALWKKKYYQQISKEFLSYKFCGDWAFWIELAKQGDIHISGKTLNYFRKHGNDVSGKATKSGLGYIETLKILQYLYIEKLINDREYNKAYKSHFKSFWKEKHTLGIQTSKQIKELFKTPLSTGTSYYRTLLSAIWNAR